jgi:transcriptional regulator GlxA family with amidase domain
MGISPSAYRQGLRIDNAKNLLSSTELPISEVGILCGFSDSLYFSRIFRQKTGCSPTEYRRKGEE